MTTFDKFCIAVFMTTFANMPSKAQLNLASDPLYVLKFEENFSNSTLDVNKWHTGWSWWNGHGANYNFYFDTCSNAYKSVCNWNKWDVAYNYQSPQDTAYRKFFTGSDPDYMRIISNKESTPINNLVTWFPCCPSSICSYNNANCSGSTCTTDSTEPFKFSTAMLRSKYRFTYGYFEIRFRMNNLNLPANAYNSYGPNFWMWGSHASNNANYSEIDVFEVNGKNWKMAPNAHFQKQSNTPFWDAMGNPVVTYQPYPFKLFGPYSGNTWHTAGCEWTPDHVDFYYDSNDTTRRYATGIFPVDSLKKMKLLVDVNVLPAGYCSHDSATTQWPFQYDVDYVRVYQVKQNCVPKSFLNTSSSTYADTLYQNLTIGGSGGSAIFNSGTHHLAGQDYVLLQEGFEVSGTGTVIISCMKCQNSASNPQEFSCCTDASDDDENSSNFYRLSEQMKKTHIKFLGDQ